MQSDNPSPLKMCLSYTGNKIQLLFKFKKGKTYHIFQRI